MQDTTSVVQEFLRHLSQRDLDALTDLFAGKVDWFIPGDAQRAPWLGRRSSREDVRDFYALLWQQTEPLSANIAHIFIDGDQAAIMGDFSTRMLSSGRVIDSPFSIHMRIENGRIVRYRLLEDSHAVSLSLAE